MLTITKGIYRATLEDGPGGVVVTLYERARRGAVMISPYREVHRDVLDAPFHVVCDRVHDLVVQLAWGAR